MIMAGEGGGGGGGIEKGGGELRICSPLYYPVALRLRVTVPTSIHLTTARSYNPPFIIGVNMHQD